MMISRAKLIRPEVAARAPSSALRSRRAAPLRSGGPVVVRAAAGALPATYGWVPRQAGESLPQSGGGAGGGVCVCVCGIPATPRAPATGASWRARPPPAPGPPPPRSYVIASTAFTAAVLQWQAIRVAVARKKYGIEYPKM